MKPDNWESMTDEEKDTDASQLANSLRGAFILAQADVTPAMTKEETREALNNRAEEALAEEAHSDAQDLSELVARIDAWWPPLWSRPGAKGTLAPVKDDSKEKP